MASAKHSLFIITALCFLLSARARATATVSQLVKTVCNGGGITDRNFCLKALSAPKAAACKNPKDLMKFVMTQAREEASSAITLANPSQLTNSPAAVNKCLSTYKTLMKAFTLEVEEMEEDPMSASYDSKIDGDTLSECKTALGSAKIDAGKINAANERLEKLISISFEVANAGGDQRRK